MGKKSEEKSDEPKVYEAKSEWSEVKPQEGYIQINRTAGLDMIYLKENITPKEILELYYQQNETEV